MQQQQRRQRPAPRRTSAAGCVRALFGIVAMGVVVYVIFVLLLGYHF